MVRLIHAYLCILKIMDNSKPLIRAQEFQALKKEGSGIMSRLADSFHNMSASYMVKSRPTEFANLADYVQSFGEKLGTIDRVSQRVLKEQYGEH